MVSVSELVLSLYRGLIEVVPPPPTMREIAVGIATKHGLTLDELMGPQRAWRFSHPRQEAMAAIVATRRFSFPQIGRFFNRDHTTVLYAARIHLARQSPPQSTGPDGSPAERTGVGS